MSKHSHNPANSLSKTDYTQMELDNTCLRLKNSEFCKQLSVLQHENAQLSTEMRKLKIENFQLQNTLNSLEIVFEDMNLRSKLCLKQVVAFSNDFSTLVEITEKMKNGRYYERSLKKSQGRAAEYSKLTPDNNRTLFLKPHAVNGTILNEPTIRLTRISLQEGREDNHELGQQEITEPTRENNFSLEDDYDNNVSENGESDEDFEENQASDGSLQMSDDETQYQEDVERVLSPIAEETDLNKSRQSLLSGSFRDVKIYLNQTPPSSCLVSQKSPLNTTLRRKPKSGKSDVNDKSLEPQPSTSTFRQPDNGPSTSNQVQFLQKLDLKSNDSLQHMYEESTPVQASRKRLRSSKIDPTMSPIRDSNVTSRRGNIVKKKSQVYVSLERIDVTNHSKDTESNISLDITTSSMTDSNIDSKSQIRSPRVKRRNKGVSSYKEPSLIKKLRRSK